ncbi:hypothetical protein BZA77DRAFT_298945 [Pyronema omphalodes]|nr:hypothetical protein BZA77DRAFT_298945 [Pyronema omphalodes]
MRPLTTLPTFRLTLRPYLRRSPCRRTTTIATPPPPPPARSLLRRLAAPVTGFIAFYGTSQRAHPWITQIATSTSINALGDANAQLLFSSADTPYDYFRTFRMVATGALLAIPVNSWYTRISYCFTTLPHMAAVLLRVGLSQAIFTPFFLVGFFGFQGLMEGKSPQGIREKIETTGPRAWRDGLVVWPFVSTLNFAVVPLEYRALVGGVASLGWNTWLSFLNAKKKVVEDTVIGGAPVVEVKEPVKAPVTTPVVRNIKATA